jgi:DNA helicase-2/ATP-dependent DNA helicase PcrA
MANKLIISAAGSGKTTTIVNRALEINDGQVLITTYTEANELEIKNKFIKLLGCIPKNVTVKTWFSLLIQHGVKPYQSYLYEKTVKGLILVNQRSGLKGRFKGFPIYFGEENELERHYFSKDGKIYSDKLSKFVFKINKKCEGLVVNRLIKIYPNIFIDESQDLAGYDLSLVKLLAKSSANLLLVCDPRQVTYLTHNEKKYEKYKNGLLKKFIEDECSKLNFFIDEDSLSVSYRCNEFICSYSNQLYPEIKPCKSAQKEETGHDGIFLVRIEDCEKYLQKFNPVQLRWDAKTKGVNGDYEVFNFGLSKGLTFDRVLIYPTVDMLKWMKNKEEKISDQARAKFYVGLTRAKYSVGIVCNSIDGILMEGIEVFQE